MKNATYILLVLLFVFSCNPREEEWDYLFSLLSPSTTNIDFINQLTEDEQFNIIQYMYFNMGGGASAIYDHELMINTDRYVLSDADLIPTGEIGPVEGSPLDFRTPKPIGADIDKVEGGYDHCYVLDGDGRKARLAARVIHPESGRVMEVLTTEPGIQFYSSNFLEGLKGKGGQPYGKHQALCLETQHYPDSPNHPEFPNTILRPGETYTQRTIYRFSTL